MIMIVIMMIVMKRIDFDFLADVVQIGIFVERGITEVWALGRSVMRENKENNETVQTRKDEQEGICNACTHDIICYDMIE